jgi:hypothetical protein
VGTPFQNSANKATVADQQVQCYELRLKGHSIRAIAAMVGLSKSCVDERIKAEIESRVIPLADEVRKMQLDRLDAMYETAQSIIDNTADPELKLKALDRQSRAMERWAKLMGIDIPVSQEVVVREGYSEQEVELQRLLAQTQQRNQVKAAELNGTST